MTNTPPENSISDWWETEEESTEKPKCGYPVEMCVACYDEKVYSLVEYRTVKGKRNSMWLCYKHHVRRWRNKASALAHYGDKYVDLDISWEIWEIVGDE